MTKPKNKVSLLGLVVAFVFMVAGIFMFVPNNIATVSAEDLDNEIHFNVTASEQTIVFAPGATTVSNFTVTYAVATQNDGINNLVFIPSYNKEVFNIANIAVNADSYLNGATITNEYSTYAGDYVKIAQDSTTTFEATGETLVTITYATKSGLTYQKNGTYNFSLLLNYTDLSQTRSSAYYFLSGESTGEQEEVKIVIDQQAQVELYIQQVGQLELVTTTVEYDANEVGISLNGENEVTYSYTGSNEVTWTWYDEENGNVISTPTNAGTYYLTGVMAANNVYSGASTAHAVVVTKKAAAVVIDNKESVYGDALLALTRQAPTGLLGNDTLSITLSTTAEQGSPVGTYPITGTVGTGSNPNYTVTFTNGTYTITARAITITADSKTLQYGENPVELTPTVVNGINNDEIGVSFKVYKNYGEETQEEIELSNETNVGVYTIVPSATNTNYTYTYNNGTYTVESVGKTADYIKSFFSGATVEYDATSHNLLVLRNKNDNEEVRPNWINSNTYTVTSANNNQTNVSTSNNGKYIISVAVTLDAQDAANYTNGDTQFNFTVEGEITPKAITVKAADKSHFYGEDPVELTPTTAGLNNEIAISFKVYDLNDDEIELSKTTNVDLYDIVPQVGEYSNYTITTENGTYEVKKATADVSVIANGVIYNRALDYTVTATVNGVTITPAITISKEVGGDIVYQNGEFVNGSVLDAGIYRVTAVAAETDNYYADSEYKSFTISKVDLATPTVSYENGKATWTVVSNDAGAENVDAKALVNGTTVTYAINNVAVDGTSYTATSADALTLTISSSNANYKSVSVNLATLFAVTFNEGDHSLTSGTPTDMPETQYIFDGQTAVEPADPSIYGYTFNGWKTSALAENNFDFDTAINGDITLTAQWNAAYFTVTFKKTADAEQALETVDVVYNGKISTNPGTPTFELDPGITYTFHHWYIQNNNTEYNFGESYLSYVENEVTVDYVVTGDVTFIAYFTETPNNYELTYMLKTDNGDYAQYGQKVSVAYNTTITYETLNPVQWFRTEAWFENTARTTVAPAKMPADNLTVYGAYVFNIGSGDVNGDGEVTTDDITLYRQWIVGGYTMKVVAKDSEYETATSEQFNVENVYYLKRVADINVDQSKDIRDVSITRMSIAGGYKWDIVTGENVTGEEIIRNVYSANIDNIEAALLNGGRATVYADITDLDKEIEIVKPENIYIDLNGHTVYIKSFVVRTTGVNATITVLNGTIKTTDGITIAAPNGNVILQDLEGWVNDNQVNLQAASNSLHIKQNVAFYNYAYEQQANQQEQVLTLTPAIVKVEKDTHIHVEEEADLVVEKIVVTEDNFENVVAANEEEVISITVDSEVTNVIKVDADVKIESTVEETKVVTPEDEAYATITAETRRYVTTEQELKDALAVGGKILIGANISSANGYLVTTDADIDLRGYTITVTSGSNVSNRAFKVQNGATLSVANGTVDAKGTKDTGCYGAFRAEVGTTLNLTNLTLKNYRSYGLNVKVLGATATLENVNITSVWGGGIEVTDNEGANGTITGYAVLRNCVMTQEGYYDHCSSAVSVSGDSTLDVYSTSYTGEYGIYAFSSGGVVNVYDGTFTATSKDVVKTSYDGANYGNNATVNIYSGTFNGTFGIGNSGHEFLNIYGGTFDHDPTNYVAENYYVVENNGVYTVKSAYVTTEEELAEALANNAKNVILGADIDLTTTAVVLGNVTLDLNGHKLYNTTDLWIGNNWSLISVRGGNLTINGNGLLDAKENDCYAIDVQNGAELVVNGGTYYGNISAIYAHSGNVTVNGGEFHLKQVMTDSGNAYRFMLNCLDASYKNGTSNFTVNGGTFNGFNPADNASEVANTNYVTAKHYVEENNGVYTVKEYNAISNAQELLAAVANGGYYQVVADFTVNQMVTVAYDFILDGNNHTITFNKQDNGNYAFNVDDNYTAQVIAEFSNLNIVSTGYQVAVLLNADFNSRLTLNNVDITCDGECVYSNGHATVYATDCDFTHSGIYATGKDPVYYSALIVGYGATINATNCNVESFGNGVSTFPSGGYVNLVNTNITVSESASVNENAGYAIWARNEDYTSYPEYCRDSVITINGGKVVGELKITDSYPNGHAKNMYESKIVITDGKFDNDPEAYVADGYYSAYVEDEQLYWVVANGTIIGGGQNATGGPLDGPGFGPSLISNNQ